MYCIGRLHSENTCRTGSIYYDKLQHALVGTQAKNNNFINNQERTNETGLPLYALEGETGSGLVDRRWGRSKTGSVDSTASLSALILCAINALCLLFGVDGLADKDCDLTRTTGTPSNGSAASSSDCDSLVEMDGKPSNAGETRGRDGLEFNDGARLRDGDTLGTGGNVGPSVGSCCLVTTVNPRDRPTARGFSGTLMGRCGATSS